MFGGEFALSLIAPLLFLATILPIAFFLGRLRLRIWVEGCLLFLLAFALLPYSGVRPHFIGASCLAVMALLVERPFGWRKAAASAILLSVWLNFHGSFIFGFALLGIAAFVSAIEKDAASAGWTASAAVVAAASTIFSPYGFELWTMPLRLSSNESMQKFSDDWSGVRPFTIPCMGMSILIALAAMVFVLLSFQYTRLTPFAAPILVMVIAERLAERAPAVRPATSGTSHKRFAAARTPWTSWAALVAGFALFAAQGRHTLDSAATSPLPTAVVRQLIACGAPRRCGTTTTGAATSLEGDGKYQVGMDGRAKTVYDSTAFTQYIGVFLGQVGAEQALAQSPVQYALTSPTSPANIDCMPGWRRVYADSTAVVSARDGAVWNCAVTPHNPS
jgi:hypothetical protein